MTFFQVAAGLLAIAAGQAFAQPVRSITYQTTLENGSELALALVDTDFDGADYDGTLVFVGTLTHINDDPIDVTFTTNLPFLRAGTEVNFVTESNDTASLGVSATQNSVVVSSTDALPSGIGVTSVDITDGQTSDMTIEGDFADLEWAASSHHSVSSLELALAQSLAAIWWPLIPWNPNDFLVTRKQCEESAVNICGAGCVESVDYTVTYNDDGTVITSTSCSYTCKDPCP